MNLDLHEWKEFSLGKLFRIKKGKRLTAEDQEEGTNNYIGAIDSNNGIANHIGQKPIHEGNTISLSYNGSVGEAFYQKEPYWATDDVNALYSKFEGFNEKIGLFLCAVIRKEKYKFSYGRKWTLENMNATYIKLPIQHDDNGKACFDLKKKYSDEGYIPDWKYMESFIDSLHHKPLTTTNTKKKQPDLNTDVWKEFTLNKVFKLQGGFYNKKPEHSSEGAIPFLASTESNNGVTEYYSLEDIKAWDKVGNPDDILEKKLFEGNSIAVTVNGSVCNAFYQADEYTCSHDITSLYLRGHDLNVYIAEFLCTVIMLDKYRWSYGRKPHDVKKFGKSIIKLPIRHMETGLPYIDSSKKYSDEGFVPDWEYMELFIKSLPYGDRLDA
jgi:hypothetical protein